MMNCIGMINWCIQKTAEKIVNEVCQAHCHCPHLHGRRRGSQGPEDAVPILDREGGEEEGSSNVGEGDDAVTEIMGALGEEDAHT